MTRSVRCKTSITIQYLDCYIYRIVWLIELHRPDDFKSLDLSGGFIGLEELAQSWYLCICLPDIKSKWIRIFWKLSPDLYIYIYISIIIHMFFFLTGLLSFHTYAFKKVARKISGFGVPDYSVRDFWTLQVVASMVLSHWKRFLREGDFQTLEGRKNGGKTMGFFWWLMIWGLGRK